MVFGQFCFFNNLLPMNDFATYYASLHQRIQQGDNTAFQKLFDSLWKPLYVWAQSVVMDEDIAKDIVQEVWIDYWKRCKKIQNLAIDAYLRQAVRYKVYNYLRDRKFNTVQIEVIQELLTDELTVGEPIALQENLTATEGKLHRVLKSLPKRCREIFSLSREEGMSNSDIATHYGISKRTVENQITFALKKLREVLGAFF
jgi:RNA polymerase sigma-70 factor